MTTQYTDNKTHHGLSGEAYIQQHGLFLRESETIIKDLYYTHMTTNEKEINKDYPLKVKLIDNDTQQRQKQYFKSYKTLRNRKLETYDNNKAIEYEKFLRSYNKIENIISKNSQVYVYDPKNNDTLISLHRFYFGNYNYRSTYYDYLIEQEKRERDNNEYALFIHYNLHTAVKMLFEFIYAHNIDNTVANIAKIMFFINNFPFRINESVGKVDSTTYSSLIIDSFPLAELYYRKVEKVYYDMKNNGQEKDIPETVQEMFLEIVDSINNGLSVYYIHLDDILDYLTNDAYNDSVYNVPLDMAITSMFQYIDMEEAFSDEKVKERVQSNPDTKTGFLPFGSYFRENKGLKSEVETYKLGYEYLMKKMNVQFVFYKERLYVSQGDEHRSYDPYNGHREYVFYL